MTYDETIIRNPQAPSAPARPAAAPQPAAATDPAPVPGILVSSTIAAIVGALAMVLLHEIVHLIVGTAQGAPGRLYPFAFMAHEPLEGAPLAIEALSAPLFSLVTGAIAAAWQPLRRQGGFWHLVWVWFAFTSILEGVGYLVITPFGAGDTATAMAALGLPDWLGFLAMAIGIGGMLLAARAFAPVVQRAVGYGDKPRSWALAFWPWLIATVATVLLFALWSAISDAELTIGEQIAVWAAPTVLYLAGPMSFMFAKQVRGLPVEGLRVATFPVSGMIALAVLLLIDFVLVGGPAIG